MVYRKNIGTMVKVFRGLIHGLQNKDMWAIKTEPSIVNLLETVELSGNFF